MSTKELQLLDFDSIKGDAGKSAYEYAVDGGYTGTEAEFAVKMAEEIDTSYISEQIESKVPFLKYGRALTSGEDLNSLIPASSNDDISGTYYSPNGTITNSLLNCPITGYGFVMNVMYSTGNDYRYIRQEIKNYSGGDWVRVYSNGTFSSWTKMIRTDNTEWKDIVEISENALQKTGDTMLGPLILTEGELYGDELPSPGTVGRIFFKKL